MYLFLFRLAGAALFALLVLIPGLRGYFLLHYDAERSFDRAREYLLEVSAELDAYYEEFGGRFPTDLNALPATKRARTGTGVAYVWGGVLRARLTDLPQAMRSHRGGALLDPWGRAWVYRVDATAATARLESLGADRRPGGQGPAADLTLTKRDGETALSTLGEEPLW
jgi:hypothetical protein